ncbi:MAG: tRNA 2-thiouridine(34) synthase MnmA [Thiofilum sp.]|uniref:tRNA 2-thiouridine(34) synthase MnmA n=1 Tax=Thiofilum sp. TaxID=2212733 RepID=UPI0025F80BEE|nr:tRNA 2-thiouridine(34) synthase MnmA [Thiofilum sp.]MBK8454489.1 tRNA 2-thiouridine(34) synthase MnmA [Thiofilum sp.]
MRRIIVGMSGGVDSSVAAYLLLQQGYEVEGLFMKNWEEDDTATYCAAHVDLADAQAVADKLGIKLHTVNFAAEYWDHVFEHFLAEYQAGRTPNPDILCNREIKFKAFLDFALDLGADGIATGHYARVRPLASGEFQLLRGLDQNKDQSYFLHAIGQYALSHALFPIGELEKPEVRRIAEEQGFVTARKKDSTGICFIGERKFRDFLQKYLPAQPGEIVTPEGKVLGKHQGLMYYTLGQRQGLGIGGVKHATENPWFVVDKDLNTNRLVVAQGHQNDWLLRSTLEAEQIHWISERSPALPLACTAKIRYRQLDSECYVQASDSDCLQVRFEEPQRAVTPGQSIVWYQDEVCLGGAIIT